MLATQRTTRSPLVRQPPRKDETHRSVKPRGQASRHKCTVWEHLLNGCHKTSVCGKRAPKHTVRVIAKNLIGGTVTVRAQSEARALAEVEQRINPKLRQDGYEFQRMEFLEIVQRTQCADA